MDTLFDYSITGGIPLPPEEQPLPNNVLVSMQEHLLNRLGGVAPQQTQPVEQPVTSDGFGRTV